MTSVDALRQADGRLDRPMPEGLIALPAEVQIDGDWLVWPDVPPRTRVYRPGEGLLARFIALADASDENIRRFAQGCGMLWLCRQHQLPYCGRRHRSLEVPPIDCGLDRFRKQREFSSLRELAMAPVFFRERIGRWRELAREARGLLHVSAALHAGETPEASAWNDAFNQARGYNKTPASRRTPGESYVVGQRVNEWIEWAGLRPALLWLQPRPPVIAFSGVQFIAPDKTTLFSAIALRLMMAVVAGDAMAFCTHCGAAYSPSRRPAAGRRNFCRACRGRGVPVMYAQRARRLRQR
jgi:hypothetical protein